MTLPDGTRVGWGVGCGIYNATMAAGEARLRVGADGTTILTTSGHEMGQGIRSVIAATVLRDLDVDPSGLEIRIGDTGAFPQFVTAGQWGTTSCIEAIGGAVRQVQARMAELAGDRHRRGNLHQQLAHLRRPFVEVTASQLAPGQELGAVETFRRGGYPVAGPAYRDFTSFSYSAHFVEVRIGPRVPSVVVSRVVSLADCGRVVSPRTARSQLHGGVVWGIGATLHEGTEIDPRFGGYLNADLADYVVPVNADIRAIEVDLIDEPDPLLNAIGAKGLGEVVMVGVSAAIANAIFHATGRRLRDLPIRIENLI